MITCRLLHVQGPRPPPGAAVSPTARSGPLPPPAAALKQALRLAPAFDLATCGLRDEAAKRRFLAPLVNGSWRGFAAVYEAWMLDVVLPALGIAGRVRFQAFPCLRILGPGEVRSVWNFTPRRASRNRSSTPAGESNSSTSVEWLFYI